jgi:Type II secretion system (T2SS), protein G
MAELDNSARKVLRATYAQITPSPRKRQKSKRAFVKHSLIANLRIRPDELDRLKRLLKLPRPVVLALDAVVMSPMASALDNAPRFAEIDWDLLASIAETLAKLREEELGHFRNAYGAIVVAYEKSMASRDLGPRSALAATARKLAPRSGQKFKAISANPEIELKPFSPTVTTDLKAVLEWGIKNGVTTPQVKQALKLLPKIVAMSGTTTKDSFESWALAGIHAALDAAAGIKQSSVMEPVGLLHLERLNFVPAGIERGELVHSVPLSPGEEVNISHKEWAHTSEEFSKIVTDFMEAYSEEGVTEKSELAQSTNSQEQHSSGFNTGVTASGGYGPVSVTTSLNYNVADSASQTEQIARNHSSELTRKASARSKKEHKISFKVASAAGTEDQQVRKIKNPFSDKATRVDYYQLVRKWRVDLFRYGLRLTYDITIPEPGAGLLKRLHEIEDLQAALEIGFGDPKAPQASPAYFDMVPNQIQHNNYILLAAPFGAAVSAPPDEFKSYDVANTHHWNSFDESKIGSFYTLEIEVDDQYQVDEDLNKPGKPVALVQHNWHGWQGEDPPVWEVQSVDDFLGKSGKLILVYFGSKMSSLYVELSVRAKLRQSAFEAWQLKAWSTIRDAAQALYEQNRQAMKDRLAHLLEQLGAQDPLSLRKLEREEVMKGVIRWLFGPRFDFAPTGVPETFFGSDIAAFSKDPVNQIWISVFMNLILAKGEVIKFLHHAIEWENMLYFLYPYFWSYPAQWEFKKYLDHPDLMHRAFLKSGSTRVVLTIRPGFEKHFLSFLETGKFDPLTAKDPYWKITEEMEAYANTNYPGLRPANPIEGARPLLDPKQKKAWDEMQIIMKLIDGKNGYFERFKTYPSNLSDLQSVLPYDEDSSDDVPPIAAIPTEDPWGNDYVYTFPGSYNSYDLVCYGADGIADKEQTNPEKAADVLNADITSWAEASLIGRWYEYTPTSALDIAFDETKPEA